MVKTLKKILIVDDDKNICDMLSIALKKEGYGIMLANTGNEALAILSDRAPDLVLLDVMLPDIDGWQVCREIRKKSDLPIIFVTAKSEIFNKLLGFELGADDYIVKPFDMREVLARVKALMKRINASGHADDSKALDYDGLHIDLSKYELIVKGKPVSAPPKELELLYYLASNPNMVFTRNQLLDEIWGFEYYGDSRTIDVHIKRVRSKINKASGKWHLKTVWGIGYKFESEQNGH